MEPLLLTEGSWQRFAVKFSPPAGTSERRGALLFVPAFAEEMNKARRTVALCSRALAARGWAVLLLDPLGCGDSPGEFGDASWEAWTNDVDRAHKWLSRETGATAGLWAMRGGALLAAAALPRIGRIPQFLLWQPAQSGKTHLQQFLRLKVAGAAIAGSGLSTSTRELLEGLRRGESVEVAGYCVAPSLALPMHDTALELGHLVERVIWLEVSAWDPPELAQAARLGVEALKNQGLSVEAEAVVGPAFWLTQEIEECQTLVDATLAKLDRT